MAFLANDMLCPGRTIRIIYKTYTVTDDTDTSIFIDLHAKLHAAARRILTCREDAEDAVQELFIRVWSNGRSDSTPEQRRAFLHTSLRNICIDMLRRRRSTPSDSIPEMGADTSAHIEDRDTLEAVRKAARRRLSGVTLRVFELYSFEELDYDEIAQRLGIRVEVARSYMCRARKALREECQRLIDCK